MGSVKLPNKILLDKSIRIFGKGMVSGRMQFKIKAPKDSSGLVKKIETGLGVSASVNTDAKDVVLEVEYIVALKDEKTLRAKVMDKVSNAGILYDS
jgi:hypothetical protein